VGEITMKEKIKQLITSGDFQKAIEYIENEDRNILEQVVLELGFDEESISAYSFVCYLINNNETAYYHYLASELLSTALCHLPDAYASALYHAKRAVELSPEDVSLKEHLLLFHDIPEKLISKEEAKAIAQEILKIMPNSEAAKNVLHNA